MTTLPPRLRLARELGKKATVCCAQASRATPRALRPPSRPGRSRCGARGAGGAPRGVCLPHTAGGPRAAPGGGRLAGAAPGASRPAAAPFWASAPAPTPPGRRGGRGALHGPSGEATGRGAGDGRRRQAPTTTERRQGAGGAPQVLGRPVAGTAPQGAWGGARTSWWTEAGWWSVSVLWDVDARKGGVGQAGAWGDALGDGRLSAGARSAPAPARPRAPA